MDKLQIGFMGVGAVLALIGLRIPIGVVLAVVSFAGVWMATSMTAAVGVVRAIPYQFIATWSFSAVPMFLLMGYIASHAGLTTGLFKALRLMLVRVPGGLAVSSVGATALFSAASGSSIATAAAMAKISIPEMLRSGYDKALATGSVAAAGTLGAMIPPSILMVLYGVFTQTSIGRLFMAGFVPGILSAILFSGLIVGLVLWKPSLAPRDGQRAAPGELRAALLEIWPLPVLVVGVLGGIFAGVMTPTEAGAIGALLAAIIALLRGQLRVSTLRNALRDTASSTSAIFVIAMGASMFTTFMGITGLPNYFAGSLLGVVGDNPLMLILIIAVVYIIMGMFIDSIGIMLLTLPILMPLLTALNIDMIWFGIIVIKLLEIGLITPPVGLNVFVVASALQGSVSLATVFRGTSWFLIAELVSLALIIFFPAIALWLPGQFQ